ncbi:HigA family addiction module antidote protein [Paraburkholderia sp. Ac-20340]|nr:HigA family addiction module antidote protein [Paraburkholderia sp. Ac-20340]
MTTSRPRMHCPSHPGEILREMTVPGLKLTPQEAADQLGVPLDDFVRVLNAEAPVTAELALRIQAWLGVDHGGDADFWLRMQAQYDLWQAHQRGVAAEVTPARGVRPVGSFLPNTPEEEAEIQRGIADDSDTFEPTAEQLASTKPRRRP